MHVIFSSARRRVPAARKAVRVIARKTLRPAETLRSPPGNPPRPARQHSITRQPSATHPATLRAPHDNTPATTTLRHEHGKAPGSATPDSPRPAGHGDPPEPRRRAPTPYRPGRSVTRGGSRADHRPPPQVEIRARQEPPPVVAATWVRPPSRCT